MTIIIDKELPDHQECKKELERVIDIMTRGDKEKTKELLHSCMEEIMSKNDVRFWNNIPIYTLRLQISTVIHQFMSDLTANLINELELSFQNCRKILLAFNNIRKELFKIEEENKEIH